MLIICQKISGVGIYGLHLKALQIYLRNVNGGHIFSAAKKPVNCVFYTIVKHSSRVLFLFIFRGLSLSFHWYFISQQMPQTGVTLMFSSGYYVSRSLRTNCCFPARGHFGGNALKVPQLGGSCQVRRFLLTCTFLFDSSIPTDTVLMVETRSLTATMCMWERSGEKCLSSVSLSGFSCMSLGPSVFVWWDVRHVTSYGLIWQW